MKDLDSGNLEYEMAGEFLEDLKKKFREEDAEVVKVAELRKLEQEGRIIKEFMQELRRAARECGYKERPLVEEFKSGMNRVIRRKLIETERSFRSIKQ